MSRVGKAPISVPEKVDISIAGNEVIVKGPLGSLKHAFGRQYRDRARRQSIAD